MKVRLLPLAIAAAVAAPGVALADATVYGKLNVAYGMTDYDYGYDFNIDTLAPLAETSADRWDLNSYDSRLGFKGEEKISDGLTAFYQAEFGIFVDDGEDKANQTFTQRNIFVGFKGGWGALQAGRFDTPLKSAQGSIDQFGDTSGDLKHAFLGENRASNIVQYSTPDMGGFQANVAIIPGEEFDTGQADPKDGPADSTSLSVTFKMDNLYVALAHDSEVTSSAYYEVKSTLDGLTSASAAFDTTRLVGAFTMDALELGAMYQTAETSDSDVDGDVEQDGFLLSAGFKIDQIKLKAQYAATTLSDNDVDVDNDAELFALGADYILSKQTNLYAHYTTVSYEYDVDGGESQTFDKIDLGVVHKF